MSHFPKKRLFRHFQNRNGLFACYRRKACEKNRETFTAFKIIEKVFDRNTSPCKNRRPTNFFGIDFDNIILHKNHFITN